MDGMLEGRPLDPNRDPTVGCEAFDFRLATFD